MSGSCSEIRKHFPAGSIEHGSAGHVHQFIRRPNGVAFRYLEFTLDRQIGSVWRLLIDIAGTKFDLQDEQKLPGVLSMLSQVSVRPQ